MTTIYESLTWHEIQVTSNAASRYIPLVYGEVGTQGTRITLIAGTHGDEGPWSALAMKKLLRHPIENLKGRIRVIPTANALAAEANARIRLIWIAVFRAQWKARIPSGWRPI
jgi:predicted deacylase